MNITNNTGIIFSDLFINNKEMFVDFFEAYYIQNEQILRPVIEKLNAVLTQYNTKQVTATMAESFQSAWKEFQNKVLLNQRDLQIIVAYRGQGGRDGQFSQILKQADIEGQGVTGTYGIDSGNKLVQDSIAALKASEIEKFLQSHLNGFLNQLDTLITKDEAAKIYQYHKEYLHKGFLEDKNSHLTGTKWRIPFYGADGPKYSHYYSGRGLGQAYDAFMNHLANHNRQVYDYLAQGGLVNTTPLNTKEKGTVFTEEHGVESYGTFPYLLNESKNHTGWYTGGDIVIVNPKTMGIVYNIQLKTTTEKTLSVFAERVSEIRKFINALMTMTPRQKGEKIFDFLLTSVSNRQDFNNLPQETIDGLLKETFERTLNIQFK